MRSVSSKSLAVMLIVSTLIPLSASFAKGRSDALKSNGPGGSGGGHWIESGFRTKTEEIFKFTDEMSDEGKRLLKFDPVEILTNLLVPGRFQPKCAEENSATLQFLRQQNKMAYVGADGAGLNEISLDCSKDKEQKWQEQFKSEDDGSHVFFIHEALRNNQINAEAENDYRTSGSYTAARRANGVFVSREIKNIVLYGHHSACALTINIYADQKYTNRVGNTAEVTFTQGKRGVAIFNFPSIAGQKYDYHSVLMNALIPNSKFGMWVYNHAKLFGCEVLSDSYKNAYKK